MKFPKRRKSNLTGAIGETYFQNFVNEALGCLYHPVHQENDFGIDGYIELVSGENVTGKLVGIQLKHGNSYFKNKTQYGYKYTGESKHINYYLNKGLPIFIILMDGEFKRMH